MTKSRPRSIVSEEGIFNVPTSVDQGYKRRQRTRPSYEEIRDYKIEIIEDDSDSEQVSRRSDSADSIKNAFKRKPRGSFAELTVGSA